MLNMQIMKGTNNNLLISIADKIMSNILILFRLQLYGLRPKLFSEYPIQHTTMTWVEKCSFFQKNAKQQYFYFCEKLMLIK